jgi:hypothetical protein
MRPPISDTGRASTLRPFSNLIASLESPLRTKSCLPAKLHFIPGRRSGSNQLAIRPTTRGGLCLRRASLARYPLICAKMRYCGAWFGPSQCQLPTNRCGMPRALRSVAISVVLAAPQVARKRSRRSFWLSKMRRCHSWVPTDRLILSTSCRSRTFPAVRFQ